MAPGETSSTVPAGRTSHNPTPQSTGRSQRLEVDPPQVQGQFPDWGIEDVGPALDYRNGEAVTRVSSSTAKYLQRERRGPFLLPLRHAIRLLTRTHGAVAAAPEPVPPGLLARPVSKKEPGSRTMHTTVKEKYDKPRCSSSQRPCVLPRKPSIYLH